MKKIIAIVAFFMTVAIMTTNVNAYSYYTIGTVKETKEEEIFIEINNEIFSCFGDTQKEKVILKMENNNTPFNTKDDKVLDLW